MQLASHIEHPWRSGTPTVRRRRNSQVLLIGFDKNVSNTVSEQLAALDLEPHVCAEPFDGLAALIEYPGAWMSCIMDAGAFATDTAFQCYLKLFAFEGQRIGMILGNADTETVDRHMPQRIEGVDRAVRDICDAQQLDEAISVVLSRRGYAPARDQENSASHTAVRRGLSKGRRAALKSLANRLKAGSRSRGHSRGRRLSFEVAPV